MDEPSFGTLLRQHRTAAGLTQEELAEQAGLSARAITDLERGVRRYPYLDTIARLAQALQLGERERVELRAASRRPTAAVDDSRSGGGAPSHAAQPSHNLPASLTSFVGRERELGELRRLLKAERLVTLTGPGGVGKTRLAVNWRRTCSTNLRTVCTSLNWRPCVTQSWLR
jgi:transcriptional regulator with XRE-family HTH domain